MPKRVKTEDEVMTDLGAAVHLTAMEQETKTPRKTCDKGDPQDVDHTSISGQDKV